MDSVVISLYISVYLNFEMPSILIAHDRAVK
jgi:hypothetical protein